MKYLLLLCTVGVINATQYSRNSYNNDIIWKEWDIFKYRYDKNYNNRYEERKRKEIFGHNFKKVMDHNKLYDRRDVSYSMSLNEYSDLTHDEFYRLMNSYNGTENINSDEWEYYNDEHEIKRRYAKHYPSYIDWRKKGAVTRVKNQKQCGSCYAFSAIGALEGQYYIQTGHLVSFSEQNLVDCSSSKGNFGCGGGFPSYAFLYMKHSGVSTEKHYPYKATKNQCRYTKYHVTKIKGYKRIPNSERMLKRALVDRGPIAVIIDASNLQFYTNGIFYDNHCSSKDQHLNHAMLLVGYGYSKHGGQYWLLKNSWGHRWGEDGYVKLARNRGNHCGIATRAAVPYLH